MNTSARISSALVASMLAHGVLGIWAATHFQTQMPDRQSLLRTMLPLSLHLNHAAAATPKPVVTAIKAQPEKQPDPEVHPVQKFITPPVQAQPVLASTDEVIHSGHFRWSPPLANQYSDTMLAQHQAQLANQRAAQAVAVLSGMSESSLKLAQVLTTSMECHQQEDLDIACTPEPPENTRIMLKQFFSVALQAHDMKLTGNAVQVELGEAQRLALTLR